MPTDDERIAAITEKLRALGETTAEIRRAIITATQQLLDQAEARRSAIKRALERASERAAQRRRRTDTERK